MKIESTYKQTIGLNGCQKRLAQELLDLCLTPNGEILSKFITNPKDTSNDWANQVIAILQKFHQEVGKESVQVKQRTSNTLECEDGRTKLIIRVKEHDGRIKIEYRSVRNKAHYTYQYYCPVDNNGNVIDDRFKTETNNFAFTCSRFLFEPLTEKHLWLRRVNGAFCQNTYEMTARSDTRRTPGINPAAIIFDHECGQLSQAITDPQSPLFIHSLGLCRFKGYLDSLPLKGIEKLTALLIKCMKEAGMNPQELMLRADMHLTQYTGHHATEEPRHTLGEINQDREGRVNITDQLIDEFSNARLRTGLTRVAVLEKLTTAFNKEAIHKNPQREFNMLHYKMPSQKACTADLKTVYILRSIYRDIPIKYAVPGDLLYEELYTKMISGQFRATDLYGLCQRSGISISRKSIETMFQNLTHRQGVVPIDLARKTLDELAP